MPGNNGGANVGGAAIDPVHGTMVVVSKDLPALLKLELGGPNAGAWRGASATEPAEKGQASIPAGASRYAAASAS